MSQQIVRWKMKTNKQLLQVAVSQLGNTGGKYRKYAGYGGSWCNMFVYWLFNANGCGTLFPMKSAKQKTYCPTSIKWCASNLAQIPPYLAMPCDIIYFDWDKNNNPNHIGIVESKISTSVIKTIEGNTSGGKVARKNRDTKYVQAIYRPHFKPSKVKNSALTVDGVCGYNTVAGLQRTLKVLKCYDGEINGILDRKTVMALQKFVGCKSDGAWGATTSGKFQQYLKNKGYYAGKVDKEFGYNSVVAMQKWINANVYQKKPTATKPTPKPTTAQPSAKALKAVAWARSTAKSGKYGYKKYNNKNKKTKQCPICHNLTGKYKSWNCIGFVSACWFHGAGLKSVKCSCGGIGTNSFFTKVTLNSWTQRNGKGWKMIGSGSKGGASLKTADLIAGDTLICYDAKGKFHHIALYTGNGKYIDDTNTTTPHIAERPYTRLTNKYHVTRAFRYVG